MNYGNYPSLINIKKILIIKLRNLGDALLASSVITPLKKKFPSALIDLYIYKESSDIFYQNPFINDIFLYDKKIKSKNFIKKINYEIKILKKIKSKKYDLVLNLTEGDRGAIASFFSKAPIKVGMNNNKGFLLKKYCYSHLVKAHASKHEVEKNLDFLRIIGIYPKEEDKKLLFYIPPYIKNKIKNLLLEKNIQDYILIHPTSRWRFKCWPVSYFNILIKKLLTMDKKIILVSGKENYEIKITKDILKDIHSNQLLNLAGNTSLLELGALIDQANLLICLDSFSFHLSNCLKKPCISLFGPTSEITWGAWENKNSTILTSSKHKCRPCGIDGCGGSKISECLYSITPDMVLKEVEKSIKQND